MSFNFARSFWPFGHRRVAVVVGPLIAAYFFLTVPAEAQQKAEQHEPWIRHSSFEDFSAGTLADGGTNLYVTRGGEIQMIHRWDFNNDGHLDLFVGQDHDHSQSEDVLVYWGTADGPRSITPELSGKQPLGRLLRLIRSREKGATRLPSDGGGRCLIVDLNGDGHDEIVFCNFIHNYSVYTNAFVYWGSVEGYRPDRRTELPTLLAGGLAAADFNRDGFVDLAFANYGNENGERFGYDNHLESFIYWNGPTGLVKERRTSLPTISAVDCAADDLNGDAYPELLFLNNNSQEKSMYLYWGSARGFSFDRCDVWRGGDPRSAHLYDLDKDGKTDLVVIHGDNRAELWHNTGSGLERSGELPVLEARDCDAADLNRDGFVDLVFANKGTDALQVSYVYWGSAQGFDAKRRSQLPTAHASGVTLADLNGDNWIELIFANEHDKQTHDVNCYVYWNGPDGFHASHRRDLQGFGPVDVEAGDLNHDGHEDVVLINRTTGSYGPIDSFIYWGNARHYYSAADMSQVPGTGDAGTIADVDQDGYVDLIFGNGLIHLGGPEGYSADRRQNIGSLSAMAMSVADLNRDGYLDLVMPTFQMTEDKKFDARGLILWGGGEGFDRANHTELGLTAQISQSANIADFNKDGFLDLVFTDVDGPNTDLFWGDKSGNFGSERHTQLKLQPASGAEIADLNQDGWLDLILGGGWDPERFGRPTRRATLVWGSAKGFSSDHVSHLEAYDSLEQSVADLNRDGYLDIVMTNYHAYLTRTIPAFIYWGAADGTYSASRRTHLPAESSSALTVADLNQDRWMDIVVFNHLARADHSVGAKLYWGGPEGYSSARMHWVPTFGPHFGVRRDIGNLYTRRLEEQYISQPLQCPVDKTPSRLGWKSRTPHGTSLGFQLRSASIRTELAKADWHGPDGPESYYEKPGASLEVPADHHWVQYRVLFNTPDGGSTPVLDEVMIETRVR